MIKCSVHVCHNFIVFIDVIADIVMFINMIIAMFACIANISVFIVFPSSLWLLLLSLCLFVLSLLV